MQRRVGGAFFGLILPVRIPFSFSQVLGAAADPGLKTRESEGGLPLRNWETERTGKDREQRESERVMEGIDLGTGSNSKEADERRGGCRVASSMYNCFPFEASKKPLL